MVLVIFVKTPLPHYHRIKCLHCRTLNQNFKIFYLGQPEKDLSGPQSGEFFFQSKPVGTSTLFFLALAVTV